MNKLTELQKAEFYHADLETMMRLETEELRDCTDHAKRQKHLEAFREYFHLAVEQLNVVNELRSSNQTQT